MLPELLPGGSGNAGTGFGGLGRVFLLVSLLLCAKGLVGLVKLQVCSFYPATINGPPALGAVPHLHSTTSPGSANATKHSTNTNTRVRSNGRVDSPAASSRPKGP
ncbi:uncharacterized protein LOC142562296 isoform X2 [Dermacentor variabilis]|uniref:uncharacterized protein LOC142562296 isoform X2 n=1 Tax=Dermacentor variabilis TaxID=34621 RepID=UPI003F5C345D